MKKNIPNIITVFRGILTVVIIFLFVFEPVHYLWWILGCFFIASSTDFLDGFLARRWGVVSNFGIVFDPLFDKVLMLSLFLLLVPYGILPTWIWVALLIRELLVDGIKNFCLSRGYPVPAIKTAKWKFSMQVAMIYACLFFLINRTNDGVHLLMYIFAGLSLILAYVSAFFYLRIFLPFLKK